MLLAAAVAMSYLLGDISPAILIGRAHGIDIKKEGSGNAGTTNVLRTLGKSAALVTLVIDISKGLVAGFLGRLVGNVYFDGSLLPAAICATAALAGHIWPAFFGFKGGKGVATAFGALTAISPALGFSALGVVALIVIITKRVSCGSVAGAAAAPFLAHIFAPETTSVVVLLACIVIIKHRANIKRMIHGEEPKLSFGKKAQG